MRILLCVAGMPYAEAAVSFGSLIARITQSPVTLLHVASRKEEQAAGEKALLRARDMLADLSVETRLRQGNPIANILAEAREGDYDLVELGARREAGLAQRLLGSVAQAVVRRAPTSVLVVKRARPDLKRILICTGGLDVANPVIEAGAQLAGAAHAQATLLYVTSPTPSMYAGVDVEGHGRMDGFAAKDFNTVPYRFVAWVGRGADDYLVAWGPLDFRDRDHVVRHGRFRDERHEFVERDFIVLIPRGRLAR